MSPLLDVILSYVSAPKVAVQDPFAMCVAMIERDPFVGRVATGAAGGRGLLHCISQLNAWGLRTCTAA